MKTQANKMAGMFGKVLAIATTLTIVAPLRLFADAQCAYNICPKNTSIIFQDGNVTITDTQVIVLAVMLVIGVLLVANGRKIKEKLSK